MKSFVFIGLVAVVAAAAAARPVKPEHVYIHENPIDNIGIPNYNFGFEQSDGDSIEGEQVPFKLVGHNGQIYTGTYTADKNGHRPRQTEGPSGVKPAKAIKT